jgi:hypothetical protein
MQIGKELKISKKVSEYLFHTKIKCSFYTLPSLSWFTKPRRPFSRRLSEASEILFNAIIN